MPGFLPAKLCERLRVYSEQPSLRRLVQPWPLIIGGKLLFHLIEQNLD